MTEATLHISRAHCTSYFHMPSVQNRSLAMSAISLPLFFLLFFLVCLQISLFCFSTLHGCVLPAAATNSNPYMEQKRSQKTSFSQKMNAVTGTASIPRASKAGQTLPGWSRT